SIAAAIVAALLLAVVMAYLLRRPMSWFAHPAPAILAFSFVALAGALAAQLPLVAWMRHRGLIPAIAGMAVQCAALIVWMLVLAAFTGIGLGSAYLPLWWAVGGAVGLGLGLLLRDDRWWIGVILGALPAGVLTLRLLVTLTQLFVPVFGRLPMAIAPDLVLAAIVAVPVSAIALAVLPGAHRAGAPRRHAGDCARRIERNGSERHPRAVHVPAAATPHDCAPGERLCERAPGIRRGL